MLNALLGQRLVQRTASTDDNFGIHEFLSADLLMRFLDSISVVTTNPKALVSRNISFSQEAGQEVRYLVEDALHTYRNYVSVLDFDVSEVEFDDVLYGKPIGQTFLEFRFESIGRGRPKPDVFLDETETN